MDPVISAGVDTSISATSEVIGWYDRVRRFFADFKPETRSMMINFDKQTCSISFKIIVPDGWRKRKRKIVLPAYRGFAVSSMIDSSLNTHKHLWKRIGQEYVLDARALPLSETYLITMKGHVDRKALNHFVYTRPAVYSAKDETYDCYWLNSGLLNFRMLESIYTDLEIEGVSIDVSVGIGKMSFSATPPKIKEDLAAINQHINTTSSDDRQERHRIMRSYKPHTHTTPKQYSDLALRLVNTLKSKSEIERHVTVDRPYVLKSIQRPKYYRGLVLPSVTVSVATDLTLRNTAATGYLKFNKKSYIERLRSEFDVQSN